MTTPLEQHGGIVPSEFHTRFLSDKPNKVHFIMKIDPSNLDTRFYTNLLLHLVENIHFNVTVPENFKSLPIHPLIRFCNVENLEFYAKSIVEAADMHGVFFYEITCAQIIHPEFWDILKRAQIDTNYTFYDSNGNAQSLLYFTKKGNAKKTVDTCKVAAYANLDENILRSVEQGLVRHTKQNLQHMTIDTTNMYTSLCYLATKYMTDKSPFNIMAHRHPYTAIYDTFLAPYAYRQDIVLGEVGVLNGASIRMWRDYFPYASIHAFDIVEDCLNKVKDIPGVTTHQVGPLGIRPILQKECIGGKKFDILLEDASHRLDDQLLFLRDSIEYIRTGGLLIVEDIFREIPAARLEEAILLLSNKISKAILVQPEHVYRHSPGWENDRILFIWVS